MDNTDLSEPSHAVQTIVEVEELMGADLQTMLSVSRALLTYAPLPEALRVQIGALVKSIAGCRHCQRALGDLHSGSCVTGGNRVLGLDLDWSAESA